MNAAKKLNTKLHHIHFVHRLLNAYGGNICYYLSAAGYLVLHHGYLLCMPAAQYKLRLHPFGKIAAYAKPQLWVFIRTQNALNILQAVVARVAAAFAQAQLAKGQGKVIHNGERVLYRYLFLVQPILYRPPAKVHERGGPDAYKYLSHPFYFCHLGKATCFKDAAILVGKGIHHIKADVMPCVGILATGVSKAYDEVFRQ